ncbi:hypothetical protein [Acinetobacter phage Ab69]|nr:hypothetical protein [Acinetobacter phage Ab69]
MLDCFRNTTETIKAKASANTKEYAYSHFGRTL